MLKGKFVIKDKYRKKKENGDYSEENVSNLSPMN